MTPPRDPRREPPFDPALIEAALLEVAAENPHLVRQVLISRGHAEHCPALRGGACRCTPKVVVEDPSRN
jgi:hypothetical protein